MMFRLHCRWSKHIVVPIYIIVVHITQVAEHIIFDIYKTFWVRTPVGVMNLS